MKIGVIGGGAIGLLISRYLSERHQLTIYVRRNEQKELLNERGLFQKDTEQRFSVEAKLLDEMVDQDCLFICVKEYHLKNVIPTINRTNEKTPLFFIQNGMRHIEIIRQLQQNVYLGIVEHGALKINDYSFTHTGKGKIKLAVFRGNSDELHQLIRQFNQTNFPLEKRADWGKMLAEKLIINAVINPLTALFYVRNGEIITNPYLNELAKKLCWETANILNLDPQKSWLNITNVASQTKANTSSMLKDLQENRKTELEAITGYILHKGSTDTPYTTFVYHAIKALEVKNIPKEYD